jgi:mRNA interferase MazF
VRGDVVVVDFPFSDLSATKRRPPLILAALPGDDVILCQITSRPTREASAVSLDQDGFVSGGLPRPSFIRPTRLFTMDGAKILRTAGHVGDDKMAAVVSAVIALLR